MGLNFAQHTVDESARFYEAVCEAGPEATVPTCDGWKAADLLWHLGEVQHFWGAIVSQRLTDISTYTRPPRPERWTDLQAFFLTASDTLLKALASADDDVPVWTWFEAQREVGFVRRRQAHEALIHRLDAELAAGAVTPLDAELASDGVLEVIECIFGGLPSWAKRESQGAVGQISATDTGHRWLVRVDEWSGTSPDSGADYVNEAILELVNSGDPVFEVSGAAADVDAWLWNRPTLGEVRVRGAADGLVTLVSNGVA